MTLLHFVILIYCSFKVVVIGGATLEVGNSIDMLKNYGLLMRIFPHDSDHHAFMSNEFSTNIFDKVVSKRVLTTTDQLAEGTWKMKVCENLQEVLNEMLSDYQIEYVENIRNSFATFRPLKLMADFVGLHHVFLATNNYSFVLVQHKRCITHSELSEVTRVSPALDRKFTEAAEHVVNGNYLTVLNLTSQFGSHYVKSFSAGVHVYQVIAFPSQNFECFAKNVPQEFTIEDLNKCANSSHVNPGRIKVLGDPQALDNLLNTRYRNRKYEISTIFSAKKKLADVCETTDNLAITGFTLTTISDLIRDREKSMYVREVIDNQIKLREISL